MRRVILVCALAACGGTATPPPPISARASVPVWSPPRAPSVTSPSVLARDDGAPPILVLVDARGARSLASAASWADVSVGKWSAGPKPASDEASARYIEQAVRLGKDPKAAVDGFVDAEAGVPATPPEAANQPDEDEDEPGGTGTAMALDEGKMGKKDSDRAEGQYRMARIVSALVIADPQAKALAAVEAVTDTQARIGVAHGSTIRPLAIELQRANDAALELQLAATGLTVEAGPSERTQLAWADLGGKLNRALADARQRGVFPAGAPVDVRVGPEVSAQQLVDVLVALDGAGVKLVGLGALAAAPPPTVASGQPSTMGDLDKPTIRRSIRAALPKIQYCYEKALVADPNLKGTVTVSFVIDPTGKVASSSATGVDPAVASCVAAAVKDIQFPKPKGGSVHVNYPFTFRTE